MKGYGAVSKRCEVLADEVRNRVRKSGGACTNAQALREVLSAGDDDAA